MERKVQSPPAPRPYLSPFLLKMAAFPATIEPCENSALARVQLPILALMLSSSKSIVFSLAINWSFPYKYAVRVAWTFKSWVTELQGNLPGTISTAEKSEWAQLVWFFSDLNCSKKGCFFQKCHIWCISPKQNLSVDLMKVRIDYSEKYCGLEWSTVI